MIFTELPHDCELFELPPLADRNGSARLAYADQAAGTKAVDQAVAAAGPYLLADELCADLRLKGLDLPADGEFRALSPTRWRREVAVLPEGVEVRGLILAPAEEKLLTRLGARPQSPSELLQIAEHVFFERPLKVAVRYTAPRFKAH